MQTTMDPKLTTDVPPRAAAPERIERSNKPSQRLLMIAGGTLVILALAAWMVVTSGKRKEEFASRALLEARSAAEQGNLPLAAGEFQKIIDTYRGTDAASEAVIGLNQVRMINGQSDLAAVSLREFLASGPEPRFAAPAHGMLAASLENAGRPADAAASYEQASEAATVEYLKAEYLVDAGRAHLAAGKQGDAERAYRAVLSRFPESAAVTEAKVRLAELTGGKI